MSKMGEMSRFLESPSLKGAMLGLTAAVLFGASVPLAKELVRVMHPLVIAGCFYLGSGTGLTSLLVAGRLRPNPAFAQAPLRRHDYPWLCGSIFCGGIVAALLLMTGLAKTPASQASLLLNMEGVFTALIAWVIFREHCNTTVVVGLILLTCGAAFLSVGPDWQFHLSLASLCVLGASLGWAADNNFTRQISHTNPLVIAALKGLTAGTVNMSIALASGAHLPGAGWAAVAAITGFLSYGLGLVFSILSMRHIGAARASAYFCSAPFVGAGMAIVFFHEAVTTNFVIAAVLMALGLLLYLSEQHEHFHVHDTLTHEHQHVHDEHHQHEHSAEDPPGEPHTHMHTHERLAHSHPHQADLHHHHDH